MGPHVAAIEKAAHQAPFLIKGLSPAQRCDKLSWLAEYDAYVEIDFSRFDMTVSHDMLTIFEHEFLTRQFPDAHPHYRRCIQLASQTEGTSKFGTRYNVQGTRCSGDNHTSIGNGVLNRFLIWVCLRKLPRGTWRSVHEGDDGIIAVKRPWLEQVEYNLNFMRCLGFSAKIKTTLDLTSVIFCGRRIIETPYGLKDACDVVRALKKFNSTMSMGDPMLMLYAKALSYNYTDHNTPIIGALTRSIINILEPGACNITKSKLKRYVAHALNERWLTHGDNVHISYSNLQIKREYDPDPSVIAAVALHEPVTVRSIQAMDQQFKDWEKVKFIPNQVVPLPLDWEPEPAGTQSTGDIRHHCL